ncbi:MAG: hypothetical protein R3C45_16525 [Phycisphaerales bacterium]
MATSDAIDKDDLTARFKWYGVYQQKPNTGHFMFRVKVPGGQLTPKQLTNDLPDHGQVRTRLRRHHHTPDHPAHWLTIGDFKHVFQTLWDVGMTSQFACGDAPRNIVGCPLAGVLEDEIIDSAQARPRHPATSLSTPAESSRTCPASSSPPSAAAGCTATSPRSTTSGSTA